MISQRLVRTPAIALFAKAPEPGRVKTRLCPPLTPVSAAALQQACLQDLWTRLGRLDRVSRVLVYDPLEARARFRDLLGPDIDLVPQREGDLGQRLSDAFRSLFAHGLGPLVAIGADSPDLPLEILEPAIAGLTENRCDIALGPAEDGGYTLIALREPHLEPFQSIPWSTPAVFETTRDRCRQAGLHVLTLPTWYDVDDTASLERLRANVALRTPEFPRLHDWFQDNKP